MASSQVPKPRSPRNDRCSSARTGSIAAISSIASTFSFEGAGVFASPRMTLVTPWVTMLTTRPSFQSTASHE